MTGARRRSSKLISAVTVVGIAVLAAACGSDNGPPPGLSATDPTLTEVFSPSPSPSDTRAIGFPPATSDNLPGVCGGTPVPGAAAYTGPGPHQVWFYNVPVQPDLPQNGVIVGEPDLWAGGPPDDVQLVACVATASGPAARTCAYGVIPEAMTMNWGEYTITLYRATTATKVAVVKIQGADDSCPSSIKAPTGSDTIPPETSNLTPDQLTRALGAYIN
jgi:hypothetical protein